LRQDVGEIDILPAAVPNILLRALAGADRMGTRIVKGP
jgi:hypothetical protein